MSAAGDAAAHNNRDQDITNAEPADDRKSTTRKDVAADQVEVSNSEDENEEEEEPELKYDKITNRLTSLYRNGDSSSALVVAGNKIVTGTHNGNIHVFDLSTVQPLRTYQAHSATVTSCSVSPIPPPPTLVQTADGTGLASLQLGQKPSTASPAKAGRTAPSLPNTPDNAIHIATSSLDGHVCIFSLLDPKDVQLRNFARPVNSVALSPEYKSDRTYLSGGRAGQLILTKGGKSGVQSEANTNSAAAAASGWLGSIGIGSNAGRDTVLHQGEGNISTIKWSLSGKWVVWVNEEGIKIMRSHLRLGSEESENAWRRINYAAKPNRRIWEEMAGVWKARAHWINDAALESDVPGFVESGKTTVKSATPKKQRPVEKLVVGWGDTTWILHVQEGGTSTNGKQQIGTADIIHKLQFGDCIVSGLCLYSPSLLAILAYRTKDESAKKPTQQDKAAAGPRNGRSHRHTGLAPQLRLISVHDGEELDVDELPMSRFETLSSQDYDFESVWIPPAIPEKTVRESKGAIEGLWEMSGGHYAQKLLSSSASVLSKGSSGVDDGARRRNGTAGNAVYDITPTQTVERSSAAHPLLLEPGLKLFVSSPYDCVLAVKRQASDHLEWLLQHEDYSKAWVLLDEQPGIIDNSNADRLSVASGGAGQLPQQSLADFLGAEDTSSTRSPNAAAASAASSEKLRIGELWLNQLITANKWSQAGLVAKKVLAGSNRWEYWILQFAHSDHFDEITAAIPAQATHPSVPSIAYEVVLGHYVTNSPLRLQELVDEWDEGLFDASAIISAIRARLSSQDTKQDSPDWRALLEAQGQLYLSLANPQEALRCFIQTKNAERAFMLIQDEKIADALSDNVTGFLTMRINTQHLSQESLTDLDDASAQATRILVEEAHKSTLLPATVLSQLQRRGPLYRPFQYFYLRTLWRGSDADKASSVSRRVFSKTIDEGHAMVEDFADTAVELFAEYDRRLLMEFLEASEVYDYNKAVAICDARKYIPELVLVLSRTGQTKRALWLIIGELGDATKAIAFVKQNPDLWDDLLEYGMDKPKFVRGLLSEVGTSIDPVKIVQRIPTGLEIPELKEGVLDLVQGWEVQLEVSRGVERVLRGEVLTGMETLRQGQRQGIHFEVVHEKEDEVAISSMPADETRLVVKPGHCAECDEIFHEEESQPLLGFACGHVYHLSCLLRSQPRTADPKIFQDILSSLGYGDDQGSGTAIQNTRSIGAKVAHADVIRRVVDAGCAICTQEM